jgi:glycosyltransferase involved in cell wall biosynthesis
MPKVSVIIPSRGERFLKKTIGDVLQKATGDIEIISILDGVWPDPYDLPNDPRLIVIHFGASQGMRPAINAAASIAKGKYLLKSDGHCMFNEGFDEVLQSDCDDNWVVIPRRLSLDAENWTVLDTGKAPVDAHYLRYPYAELDHIAMHGTVWNDRARERKDILIDDELSSQGSCWFMSKKHFDGCLGGLHAMGYGTFVQEFQEIGNKTWLSGGRVVVNKKTSYAHLHKGKKYGRGYYIASKDVLHGNHYSVDFWMNNRWKERKHDLEWLIEKFWPVPTWPSDWQEDYKKHEHLLAINQ